MPTLDYVSSLQDSKIGAVKSVFCSGYYLYAVGGAENRLVIIDIRDNANPVIVSSLQDNTKFALAYGVKVVGDYAYVCANNYFTVVSVSNKTSPSIASYINNSTYFGYALDVDISADENYAYVVGFANSYFSVVDITNKSSISVVGWRNNATHGIGLNPRFVVNDGNYCYISAYSSNKLSVINVSTPAAPTVTGSLTNSTFLANIRGIKKLGNYIYAICSNVTATGRISKIDVSTPATPVLVASYEDITRFAGNQIDIDSNYIYAADFLNKKVSIFDKSKLVNICPKASANAYDADWGLIAEIIADGNFLYCSGSKFSIIDVSTPASPTDRGHATIAAGHIDKSGDSVWSCAVGGILAKLNVTDPDAPTKYGSVKHLKLFTNDGAGTAGAHQGRIKIKDNNAFVHAGSYVSAVDLTVLGAANSPELLGSVSYIGSSGVLIGQVGNYVYRAIGSSFFEYDVSDPTTPTKRAGVTITYSDGVSGVTTPAHGAITADGNYLIIVGSNTKLVIYDISDPDNPVGVGQLVDATNLNAPWRVAISGNRAFVTCSTGGTFTVINISTKSNPTYVTKITGLTTATGLCILGSYAYVGSAGLNRVDVIDISDPDNPSSVGSVTDATKLDNPYDIAAEGNYIYCAGTTSHSPIIDVTNKANPVIVGDMPSTSRFRIAVDGDFAYLETAIYDIRDKTAPILAVSTPFSGAGTNLIKVGNYVYTEQTISVDVMYTTFYVHSIANYRVNFFKGLLLDATKLAGASRQIALSGNYLYVPAQVNNYLTIVDISSPSSLSIKGSVTNANLDSPAVVALSGNYAWVAGSTYLSVVDITDKSAPSYVGRIAHGMGTVFNMFVSGNQLLIFARSAVNQIQFAVFDITVPTAPARITSILTLGADSSSPAWKSAAIANGHAFTSVESSPSPNYFIKGVDYSNYLNGVTIIDEVTDATKLNQLFTIMVEGTQLYVGAYGYGGISIFGVTYDVSSFTPKVILI